MKLRVALILVFELPLSPIVKSGPQRPAMTTLLQDLRFALRQLRRAPGFTITAVLTLALAICANGVVFSVLNGLILRPLDVPEAQGLYGIERASDKDMSQSYPNYLDLRNRNHSFDGLAAYTIAEVALDTGEGPSRVWGVEASGFAPFPA